MTKQGALTVSILIGIIGGAGNAGAKDLASDADAALSFPPASPYIFANTPGNFAENLGWSETAIKEWYTTSQGSRLIPLNWLQALEQKDTGAPFLDKSHMATFGYIESTGPLPLGFTIDKWDEADKYGDYSKPSDHPGLISEEWVGFTCAACHTGQLEHEGTRYIVHGAPAMSDFMAFIDGTLGALTATVKDSTKYSDFETKILGVNATPEMRDELKQRVTQYIEWRTDVQAKNGDIGTDNYGYGRLDAVGHILSKVSLKTGINRTMIDPETGETINIPPNQWKSDAPVSYPHIWNASQQALVQWNGLTSNSPVIKVKNIRTGERIDTDIGALGRNVGEVTGVFADFDVSTKNSGKSYKVKSSANSPNLIHLEQTLSRLPSPKWPFDVANTDTLKHGADLYEQHCQDCHSVVKPDDVKTLWPEMVAEPGNRGKDKIAMSWLHDAGTDIWMACNSDQYGLARKINGKLVDPDQRKEYLGAYQLTKVVTSSIINQLDDVAKNILNDIFGKGGAGKYSADERKMLDDPLFVASIRPDVPNRKIEAALDCFHKSEFGKDNRVTEDYAEKKAAWKKLNFIVKFFSPGRKKKKNEAKELNNKYRLLRYKARPLNGIWATAPYLHNGSVPTLNDLLMPSRHNDPTGLAHHLPLESLDGSGDDRLRSFKTVLDRNTVPETYTGPFRPDCFYVGNLEYDVANAGYKSKAGSRGQSCVKGRSDAAEPYFQFNVVDEDGLVKPGNSNAGHNYPETPLSKDDRKALLAYLKTL